MTEQLSGLRVLIVEDETLVAMMLEDMLSDMGCVVVGVAGTVERGLSIAGDPALAVDGAVLDVNLGGEKVYPVADALSEKGVPFIFATGYGLAGIARPYSHVPAVAKPYNPHGLEHALVEAIRPAGKVNGAH